jgi:hypothetical protein
MIKTSTGRKVIEISNATIPEIIQTIQLADRRSAKFIGDVSKLKGKSNIQTYKNIWSWVRRNIKYRADGPKQFTKSPAHLYKTRVGDCKSMTVMVGAILQKMCIPYDLVVDRYSAASPNQGHIYVKTKDGVIIDPVNSRFNSADIVWDRQTFEGNNICSTISGRSQNNNTLWLMILLLLISRA